jgi:hypothetical protein
VHPAIAAFISSFISSSLYFFNLLYLRGQCLRTDTLKHA